MDIMWRVSSFVFFMWFVVLPTYGTSQDLASKEPTHVLVSGKSPPTLKFAPIGSWDQFQNVSGLNSSVLDSPTSVAFDPVEQRVYWGDYSKQDVGNVFRCKLDGTEVERVHSDIVGLVGLAIDPVNRRMYFAAESNKIQASNLDGTGLKILVNNGSYTWAVAVDTTRSRVYWTEDGDYNTNRIGRVNAKGSDYMILIDSGLDTPFALTVDEKGERLYWCDSGSARRQGMKIESSDLDGNNRTVHVSASHYGFHYGLAFYQDQLLVANDKANNVIVYDVTAGETSVAEMEVAPSTFGSTQHLFLFYKYENSNTSSSISSTAMPESPTPIFGIKVRQTVARRGMLIAVINVPIKDEMASWTLEIDFPRQVFDLKIFGCDVEIQDHSQTKPGGQRRGTKYTLVPSPGSDIPTPGSKLSFKVEAKTWQKRKGFPRGILADFYPTPVE